MRALTRRERIQRVISPPAMDEALLPAMQRAIALNDEAIAIARGVKAQVDTVERLFMPHVQMLEDTLQPRVDAANRAAMAARNALTAINGARRRLEESRPDLDSLGARLESLETRVAEQHAMLTEQHASLFDKVKAFGRKTRKKGH